MVRTTRFSWGAQALNLGVAACLAAFAQSGVSAQTKKPDVGLAQGQSVLTATPDVHFDQKVNTEVPVDLSFVDEDGKNVMLRDYINGKQPSILMMPFYKCAGACNTEQAGLMSAFNNMKYQPGRDFQVIMVSINPAETPENSKARKTEYTSTLTNKDSAQGIHYLTGTDENISKLAEIIGFHYVKNLKTQQFGHATGFVVLTPSGKTSRYFYGSDYIARDMKLALTEAGENKIGSAVDQILILCYHYDSTTGKYGLFVTRISQVLGIATVLILGCSIGLMLRAEKKQILLDGRKVDGQI